MERTDHGTVWGPFLENEVVNAAYLLNCNFMPSCKPIITW